MCVDFLLGEFFEPYREVLQLVCLVVLKCNGIVCVLMLYSKLVVIGTTELAGRSLALRFNPVSAVVFHFMHRLLRLVQLIS